MSEDAMNYENELVGYSIALPDGWRTAGIAVPEYPGTEIFEDAAHPSRRLSIRPTDVARELLDAQARGHDIAAALRARRMEVVGVSPAAVGGEANAVLVEYRIEPARAGCVYSVVRDGLEYRLTFTAGIGELIRGELDAIAARLRFPAPGRAREAAPSLARSTNVVERALRPTGIPPPTFAEMAARPPARHEDDPTRPSAPKPKRRR